MTIKVKTRNGVSRLKPEGEMTIYNAVSMKPRLIDTLYKCDRMEIDLAKVGEIDSAGMGKIDGKFVIILDADKVLSVDEMVSLTNSGGTVLGNDA